MATPPRPHRPVHHYPTQPAAAPAATEVLLYTPAEAARQLRVRESWLRRKAAARQVPCTLLGKHLRFSAADLAAIIAAHARPATGRRRKVTSTVRDRDLPAPAQRSVDPPRPDHTSDRSSPWPG